MSEIATQTLELVGREINATVGEARAAVEAFVEQPDNVSLLERVTADMHQVQGVLRLLEIYGAALLAEEMEQVTRYLVATSAERKNQAEALDALLRALVQLPGYLERVIAGGRDLALVLLPLLNDLRAVRGSPLLSEGTLLLLNLKSDRQATPVAPAPGEQPLTIEQWARRLRARFQVGLIGWIRGERIDQNLEILAAVAHKLEQVATRQPVFQLWWVTGALVEALRERGIEGGVSIKRLLGLADREVKRLYEEGEARYCQSPPVELLNNLLYYIARAESSGPKVSAVRASFRLGDLLPVDEAVEQERESLSAPSVKLMRTVGAAIREDLAKVKDVLDIFVRRGGGQAAELGPQVELLRKIGDTLGVLGLGELRTRVQGEIGRLEAIVSGAAQVDDATLIEIASTLIGVEDHLEDQLVGMIVPKAKTDTDAPAGEGDFHQVQAAVLRECMLNLARVKEAVAQSVGGTLDTAALDSWSELMRGIKAGLVMLGKTRAVEVVDGIGTHLKRVMRPGMPALSPQLLDRLADAIVSVEYYMETLQARRSEPFYMLDNAQSCLDTLAAEPEPAVPTVPPLSETTFARTLRIAPPTTASGAYRVVHGADGATDLAATDAPGGSPPTLAAVPVSPPAAVLADPELVSLFIEEAGEEVAKIRREFPRWDDNPLEDAALATVRRSFHTLKGSGRMVGAREMAEFSWSIENLLNRLIDKTLTRTPEILATLRDGVAALPQLLTALESGAACAIDTAPIIARAHALAARQELGAADTEGGETTSAMRVTATAIAAATDVRSAAAGPAGPVTTADGTDSDPALREIFSRETAVHIATVRSFLAGERDRPAPHVLTEDVYRACHTLSGSSKAAVARHGIRLAGPLDHWMRKSYDSGVGLIAEDLALVDDCMQAMEGVVGHLDEATGFFQTHDQLRARIARAETDLDRRIAEAAAAAEAAQAASLPPQSVAASLTPPAPGAVPAPAVSADYDPEIAGIFAEEAGELIEHAEQALQAWGADRANGAHLDALKRPLHTLKGGARMAGVVAMGDLAHELETLVSQIELGTVRADESAQAVLVASLDTIAQMRDAIIGGRGVARADALVARIHALDSSRAHAPAAPVLPATPAEVPAIPTLPEPDEVEIVLPTSLAGEEMVDMPAAMPVGMPAPAPEPVRLAAVAPPPVFVSAAGAASPIDAPSPPAPVPPGREPTVPGERQELARVDADLLDQLLNYSGEVSIGRARLEQQIASIDFNLAELSRTVTRLKEQLRKLEIETESQILHTHEDEAGHRAEFDPLELDRYSTIQQYSRGLAETASDVASIQQLLETLTQDTQNLLQHQARTITELQNGLMRTRMVPFQRHVQRLARIVRQAASDTRKRAELLVEGASGELDRQVLERMLPPFEHILRNAVSHGIELPAEREARGKPATGRITLALRREGAEVIVQVSDDGAGMNLKAIRDKGLALGLIRADQVLPDDDVMQLVLEPGFSTAGKVTQHSGRGVGMDVVADSVKKLGGALHMETKEGEGTSFTIRLPFTLAISHALVVRTGDEFYALPLPTVEGVVRLTKSEVTAHLGADAPAFGHNGQRFRFQHLATYVGLEPSALPEQDVTIPVILVRAGEHSTGLVADELIGSREIVVKSVGPQIAAIRGISGATILGDGRIVVILDINALVRAEWRGRSEVVVPRDRADKRTLALVIDDSITVRRVTQRLLERNGMRVLTARDGVDAIEVLQEHQPDIILLDIEMPRMDGYEVAAHVRADARLKDIPIIMITSRVGDKHRARAIEIGVDDYLGKPYQEAQLLEAIEPLVSKRREPAVASGAGRRR
jgi:chemosensory pili system protein ChpA (sensor histidine kinase/response regulator)